MMATMPRSCACRPTVDATSIRVCAFCRMPNHWHLVLWPQRDGELARLVQKLTTTQDDAHFTTVVRYVERNPLRTQSQ